ncbi:MAG: DUF1501 domain-containing protein [Minicystis sp.]
MSRLSRRTFLKGALAGGALAGASGLLPMTAGATGLVPATLGNGQTYKILEVFLDGGADFWAHAYDVPSWVGRATRFQPGLLTIPLTSPLDDWHPLFTGANPAWVPSLPSDRWYFGAAANGEQVYWGPALKPLWPHAGRARLIAVGHGFSVHDLATYLALTGTSLGRPIAASLGAALNRSRAPGEAPVSFVVPVAQGGFTSNTTLPAATATGFHGADNQPVLVTCGNTSIQARLDRSTPAAGSTVARASGDPLRNHYDTRYRAMLFNGGSRSRSRAYDAYEGSLATLEQHAGLRQRLQGVSFALPSTANAADNATSTAIRAAAGLLGNGARHVTVVDNGWDTHDDSAYSTVEGYAAYVTRKTFQLAHALAEVIAAGTLDLTSTLVFVHSEFGRRQSWVSGGNGGDHNPSGYPVLLLGGPITHPGIAGSITGPTSPGGAPYFDGNHGVAAVRGAVALAAGIDPWQPDMYAESTEWLGGALQSFNTPADGNAAVLEQAILGL